MDTPSSAKQQTLATSLECDMAALELKDSATSPAPAPSTLLKQPAVSHQKHEPPTSPKGNDGKIAERSSNQPQGEPLSNTVRERSLSKSLTLPPTTHVNKDGLVNSGSQGSLAGLTSSAGKSSIDNTNDMSNATSLLDCYNLYDYGFYPYPPPHGKVWAKKDVDDLVAFANKWIPDVKKTPSINDEKKE